MKKQRKIIISILLLIIAGFAGCFENPTSPSNGVNYLVDSLDSTSEGNQVLDAACDRYDEYLEAETIEEARSALVDDLNDDFSYVKEAFLSTDGYSICITFNDDTVAMIMTDDGLFPKTDGNTSGGQFSFGGYVLPQQNHDETNQIQSTYYRFMDEKPLPPLGSLASSNNCGETDVISPSSKNVLIFNAAAISDPFWSEYSVNKTVNKLTDLGWSQKNITSETPRHKCLGFYLSSASYR